LGGIQQSLNEIQGQVVTDDAFELVINQNGSIERSDQHLLAAEIVGGWVNYAGLLGSLGAQVVLTFTYTRRQYLLAFHLCNGQRSYLELATVSVPPRHEAPCGVIACGLLAGVEIIIPIEGIGFPADIDSYQFRCLFKI